MWSLTEDVASRKALLLQCLGWSFWLLGQALGQVAILWAPASLAASVTFGGSLLSNALLAPLLLRERLTRMHGLSIFLLVMGGLLVTSFSSHATQEYTLLQLESLDDQPHFLICAGCMAALTAVLAVRACCIRFLELWSFAYLFAVVGAIDLLVTKFTLQLLRLLVVAGPKELLPGKGFVSACVAAMITLHILVFVCQVVAAYYKKALQSLPLFLGSGALMQVVVCGTFFNEFGSLDGSQQVFFSCGFIFVMLGLVVTSMATQSVEEVKDVEVDKDLIEVGELPGSKAIITSGRLQRNSGSISSADLFMLAEIQKSALCFGGRGIVLEGGNGMGMGGMGRRHASEDLFRPFLSPRQRMLRAASAPPMMEGLNQLSGQLGSPVSSEGSLTSEMHQTS
ncbi:unnamed protein product [Cladocopium goreaui]|uniref:Magnesium transporter n=1 Tax=Cladocopium goreaui TaxID=2562237 RepID=A0A9P1DMK4_9DINO|nr:unnamed protein product [Cladocopium goreaui]